MEKRGEFTTSQIGFMVIAVASFVIVAVFLFNVLDIRSGASEQVCHLSVLARATSPESVQTYVPLKCQTERICLKGEGNNDCKYSFAGDEVRETVTLDTKDENAAAKIDEVSADAMYRCWKMMGEGKVDLVHNLELNAGLASADSTCVICSRIAVDMSKNKLDLVYGETDLGGYLQSHPAEQGSSKTYLQYFTDGQVSSYTSVDDEAIKKNVLAKSERCKVGGTFCELGGNDVETAIVFMQIKPTKAEKVIGTWSDILVGGAAGSFVLSPKWTMAGIRAIGGVVGKAPVFSAILVAGGIGYVSWNVHEGRVAAAAYCGERAAYGKSSEEGCSMVQAVPYNSEAINKICGAIESSP